MATIFVHPGEVFFGHGSDIVRTVLGSCVAIVLWHAERELGGMCHFVLPTRSAPPGPPDGRYGDEAFQLLERAAAAAGTRLDQFRAWAYGGGNMFPGVVANRPLIGQQNAATANRLLRHYRMRVVGEDLGGTCHRRVTLDLRGGSVDFTCSEVAAQPTTERA